MATTDRQLHLNEKLDATHIVLTATGIAFTLLSATTHILLPGSLSNPLILGTAIILYLLIGTLPYTQNRIFAVFISVVTCSVAAVTIAAGASQMPPDKTIHLGIQFALPLILSSLICLSVIDFVIFTFQTMMNTLQGSSHDDMDGHTNEDNPITDLTISDPSLAPHADFYMQIPESMGQTHPPSQV